MLKVPEMWLDRWNVPNKDRMAAALVTATAKDIVRFVDVRLICK